jgi:protein SCO1/2
MKRGLLLIMLLALAPGADSAVAEPVLDETAALEVSQAAIGRSLGDHRLRGSDGKSIGLGDFRGRPLVVNLVYTGCTQACPVVIQTLYDAVDAAQRALGTDSFSVATIGIDARNDTPERMRAYAREQGVDLPNWTFLSSDQATIDRLVDELGFAVVPSVQGLDHIAQTTIVDEAGVIYRHVYGAGFEVPTLVEPLKELVLGRRSDWTSVAGLVNRIKLFCTLYDPKSERYHFDYSVFVGMLIGIGSLTGVAIFVVREWRRSTGPRRHA